MTTSSQRDLYKDLYAISQSLAASGGLALALYVQTQSALVTLPFALGSGFVSFVRTRVFVCREMNESIPILDKHLVKEREVRLTPKQAHAFIWTYTLSSYVNELGTNYFILDSFLAWQQEFTSGQLALQALSPAMLVFIFLYTTCVSFPFLLSNDIYETGEEINKMAGINEKPSSAVLLKPWTRIPSLARLSVMMGCLALAFERGMALLMSVPPDALISLLQLNSWMMFFAVGALVCGLLLVTITHVIQTYYFEGQYSEENLAIAETKRQPVQKDWHYYCLKFSRFFLPMHALVDGIDDGRTVFFLALTFGYGQAAYTLAAAELLVSSLGGLYSFIWRSQMNTQDVLNEYEQLDSQVQCR